MNRFVTFDPSVHKEGVTLFEQVSRETAAGRVFFIQKSDVKYADAAKAPWFFLVQETTDADQAG